MSQQFKVAAVQAAPVFLDLQASVTKAIQYIEEAAANGAKLVAFSETWLPGYPNHIWLGPVAWQMQFVGRYFDNSIEAGSEEEARLSAACRDNNIQLSIGVSERDGGSLYIAQWHFDENGEVINRRRKLKPTHVERTVYGEGDGSDLNVVDTSIGRVGQLACWEHLQPLSKYAMYSQNEQIHIGAWPNLALYEGTAYALGHQVNNGASMMYAVEGSCFVVAPCSLVTKENQDNVCQGDPEKEKLCPVGGGYTKIYAPDGSSIGTDIAHDEEGIVYADIDLHMIGYAKAAADPAGHYSKADSTRLLLNKRKQRAVMYFDESNGLEISATSNAENADLEPAAE
ncbi:carbon-nitrogen hydrolase family protein [Epibacterium ulvae]|uniref:carbon-nitrogen hydrolase family protein n=1 Tax=Epibacterium ulvae TaxID=1156985 RepID=UPI0024926F26|nr:carbon-nitrogen hydrolase family protein [Epibacterium ulvae]